MTPFIEVSHLPSSASFYAAITQPLGIKYLSAGSDNSLNFGLPQSSSLSAQTCFNIRGSRSPTCSQITFSAQSPEDVVNFHKAALRASDSEATTIRQTSEHFIAETHDLDGNMVEVVYMRAPLRRSSAPTVITTTSSQEAKRNLDSQDDAYSAVSKSYTPTVISQDKPSEPSRFISRQTITTTTQPAESSEGGISGKTIIGTLLGAAAGAAVAYAMVRGGEPDPPAVPTRRSSLEIERTISAAPRTERGMDGPGYTTYNSKGDSTAGQEPEQIDEEPRPSIVRSRTLPAESVYSRKESKAKSVAASKVDSEARSQIKLALMPALSHVSSKLKADDEKSKLHSEARSHKSAAKSRVSSYTSAKTTPSKAASSVSTSTVRPSKVGSKAASHDDAATTVTVKPVEKSGSRKGSTVSARHIRLPPSSVGSAKDVPLPESVVSGSTARYVPLPASEVSARNVPLPASRACSIAPSDSISNVGRSRSGGSRA
jgi:hypothetical protein